MSSVVVDAAWPVDSIVSIVPRQLGCGATRQLAAYRRLRFEVLSSEFGIFKVVMHVELLNSKGDYAAYHISSFPTSNASSTSASVMVFLPLFSQISQACDVNIRVSSAATSMNPNLVSFAISEQQLLWTCLRHRQSIPFKQSTARSFESLDTCVPAGAYSLSSRSTMAEKQARQRHV